ncbi:unnamed protein product, partial [Meganyctiphanes norvegica]
NVQVNEEIEDEEKIKIQAVGIKLKEEMEIYVKPDEAIAFPEEKYILKQELPYAGERSYQHSFRGKAFSKNSKFLTHQITCTGDKQYQCIQCDKAFSQNSSLVLHQRT